jgi:hypothetical protein
MQFYRFLTSPGAQNVKCPGDRVSTVVRGTEAAEYLRATSGTLVLLLQGTFRKDVEQLEVVIAESLPSGHAVGRLRLK